MCGRAGFGCWSGIHLALRRDLFHILNSLSHAGVVQGEDELFDDPKGLPLLKARHVFRGADRLRRQTALPVSFTSRRVRSQDGHWAAPGTRREAHLEWLANVECLCDTRGCDDRERLSLLVEAQRRQQLIFCTRPHGTTGSFRDMRENVFRSHRWSCRYLVPPTAP